ncbi:MAG: SPFH domain-containing protein [Phycisphaerae bacterium]|nr:SPFH domain-containing protein [Phycisphaerae bacterium]
MTRTLPIAIGTLAVLILVLFNTTYTVKFYELAVVTRFGKPAHVNSDEGLHFKLPFFIDQVTKLDTRLQMVESPFETVLLTDDQQVVVQAFVMWKLDKAMAKEFYVENLSLEQANRRIEQELPSAIARVRSFRFADLIGAESKLHLAEAAVLKELQDKLQTKKLSGIIPVSVGINQVVLPPKTIVAVLGRMAETQKTLSTAQEQIGVSQSTAIESKARTEADTIRTFASQWAAQIAARGDAEAARYFEQMKQYRDLAIYLSWLDTLKASLGGPTTFVADMYSAPMHLLDPNAPVDANGIPQPTRPAIPEPIAPRTDAPSSKNAAEEGQE